MTTEIPEIFRALLEHPFTLPNFEDNGEFLRRFMDFVLENAIKIKRKLMFMQTPGRLLRNACQLSRTRAVCGVERTLTDPKVYACLRIFSWFNRFEL